MTPMQPLNRKDSVYPGEYTPRTDMESWYNKLCINANNAVSETPVDMLEDNDCYQFSLEMPGIKRDDILVYVHDHMLSISIHAQKTEMLNDEPALEPELSTHEFEWHIRLPEDADAEFISTEYRNGFLSFFISKNPLGSRVNNRQVVVY